MLRRSRVVASLVAILLLASCSGKASKREVTLHVLAAASLTEAFAAIGQLFEREHSSVRVVFDFAGSSALVRQLHEGAPAGVLATADEPTMQQAVAAGDATAPHLFAHNRLEIVVPRGNPKEVAGLADFGRLRVVALAAPSVPAGRYAAEAFARAGLAVPAASQEPDVKAVLTKVELGEADAGVVYVSDALAARDRVTRVTIPPEHNVVASYSVATARRSRHRPEAAAFVAAVRSPAGQRVLGRFGFTRV
jgi:molybdate transport system substrate-binding protein